MCGFFLVYSTKSQNFKSHLSKVNSALHLIENRGPDYAATHVDRGIIFGHTRLSIQDTSSSGNQPFVSQSKRYIILFNGELYNHLELRKNCLMNYELVSASDTITLSYLLDKYGISNTLDLISGMFALAIYDKQTDQITITRDMYGEKPLFFSQSYDEIHIYSDPRLVQHFNPDCGLDEDSLSMFLLTNNVPYPYCVYKGFAKLDPGSRASFDVGSLRKFSAKKPTIHKKSPIYTQKFQSHLDSRSDVIKVLSDALKDQVVSDRPVAFFLSGGIDSSLLTAIASIELGISVDSFSVAFNDCLYDESAYSTEIASILKTKHTILHFDQNEIPALLDTLISRWGEPFGDSSALASLFLCKNVSKTHRVAISGDGADEVFFGYNRYKFLSSHLADIIRRCPSVVTHVFESIIKSSRGRWIDALPVRLPRQKIQKLVDYSHSFENIISLYAVLYSMSPPRYCNATVLHDYIAEFTQALGADWSKVELVRYLDLLIYLPNDILQKVDICSMAYGLEVRSPYLDPKVTRYANQFNKRTHVDGSSTKKLLRSALAKYLPESLINRPKMGFGVSIAGYLSSNSVQDEVLDSIETINPSIFGFMNGDHVVNYYKGLFDSLAAHPDTRALHELWNLVVLVKWLKYYGHIC